jgi:hypothetical protein
MKKRQSRRRLGKRPVRTGSWRTALTEAEAARRHVAQAGAALDRLVPELQALRDSAAEAARLELRRALLDGPDGGPLTLLAKLARSQDAAAPLAAVAALLVERLTGVVGGPP